MTRVSAGRKTFGLGLAAALVATALIGGAASANSSQGAATAAKAAERGKSLKKQIKNKVKNHRYVGYNDVGDYVDDTYCANGKWTSRTGNAIAKGKSWKITNPHRTKKGFFAKLKGSGGYEIAVAKANGNWKLGIWFRGPERLHKVERSKVSSKTCRKL